MNIRVRLAPGRIVAVDVRDGRCPGLACFWPARHTVRASAGASGCSARTTEEYECGTRDQRGCPQQVRPADPRAYRLRASAWEAQP